MDRVVAPAGADEVLALARTDRVVAAAGNDHVAATGTNDLVVAVAADDRGRLGEASLASCVRLGGRSERGDREESH